MNSQRVSGYKRKPNEAYYTPHWVTHALLPHIKMWPDSLAYDPAAGTRMIVRAINEAGVGFPCIGTDVTDDNGDDFLQLKKAPPKCRAIITNPPYRQAEAFIRHALELMQPRRGLVAMLLRTDYDHAATRRDLFDWPFAMRIVLTKRIRWIAESTGSPSFNHVWLVWNWKHHGPPIIKYAPQQEKA
jgi:hypothetical protein